MLFLILFVATVVTICMVTVWSRPTVAKDAPPVPPAAPRAPESLEGVLAAKLLAGEITTTQYRHALEGLAARDEDRHPLTVPPDLGSADA
jgi:hypothetical protein